MPPEDKLMRLMRLAIVSCLSVFSVLTSSAGARAQDTYTVFGEHPVRGATRVAYWKNAQNRAAGEVAIEFGRPVWKEEYGPKLDEMTSGKIWRMGENFWSSLDTNLPVRIGGVDLPVGYYYLVITRSEDGSRWRLGFVDPAKARERTLDPYEVQTRPAEVPIRHEAPLSFSKSAERMERLDVDLRLAEGKETEGTLVIRWGDFALSAPFEVRLPS
jgi:hypothetical protein